MENERDAGGNYDEELDRLTLIRQILEKKISQKAASKLLRFSSRQLRHLTRCFQEHGPSGIISKHKN